MSGRNAFLSKDTRGEPSHLEYVSSGFTCCHAALTQVSAKAEDAQTGQVSQGTAPSWVTLFPSLIDFSSFILSPYRHSESPGLTIRLFPQAIVFLT
jgi:hypothetical protein